MRRHRIWYGLATLAALVFHLMANRRETAALLAAMVVLPLFFGILQSLAGRSAKLVFQIRERCAVNETIPLHIHLQRRNRLPMGVADVTLCMESLLYGERWERTFRLLPAEKISMHYEYPMEWTDCGAIRLRLKSVRYYDLLGLFFPERRAS